MTDLTLTKKDFRGWKLTIHQTPKPYAADSLLTVLLTRPCSHSPTGIQKMGLVLKVSDIDQVPTDLLADKVMTTAHRLIDEQTHHIPRGCAPVHRTWLWWEDQ